jgi:hypothetical protein
MAGPKKIGFLVFRGTSWEKTLDWLVDASVETVQFGDYGHVHGGFLRNVWWLGEQLRGVLGKQMASLEAILVGGHSLGGAMAALATVMLWTDYQQWEHGGTFREKLRGLYTFGAPAVGDSTFVDQLPQELKGITFLHVYENDIVPRLPPRTVGSFDYFGKVYHSADDGWVRGYAITRTYTAIAANLLAVFPFALKLFSFTRWIPPALRFVSDRVPFTRALILSWDDHAPRNYVRSSRLSTVPLVV